ncbi:unnamed protein product, partial [Iphiclides podalirius]
MEIGPYRRPGVGVVMLAPPRAPPDAMCRLVTITLYRMMSEELTSPYYLSPLGPVIRRHVPTFKTMNASIFHRRCAAAPEIWRANPTHGLILVDRLSFLIGY